MIFDALCRHVERVASAGLPDMTEEMLAAAQKHGLRHLSDPKRLLEDAQLFVLNEDWEDTVARPKVDGLTTLDAIQESFFLPFKVTAVEDPQSCILIADMADGAIGLSVPRYVILAQSLSLQACLRSRDRDIRMEVSSSDFSHKSDSEVRSLVRRMEASVGRDPVLVFCGVVSRDAETKGVKVIGCGAVHGTTGNFPLTNNLESLAGDIAVAIRQIAYCNLPDYFILEVTSSAARRSSGKKITRAKDRKQYVVMSKSAVRAMFPHGSDGGGSLSVGHRRRRHTRLLRADRFKEKKGHRIIVSECWVGPTTASDGKRTYRVRADL